MSMSDRVSAFLTVRRPSRFCDNCIAESLELRRTQNAQKATKALNTTDSFHRALGLCSMCGKETTVIQRAERTEWRETPGSDSRVKPDEIDHQQHHGVRLSRTTADRTSARPARREGKEKPRVDWGA